MGGEEQREKRKRKGREATVFFFFSDFLLPRPRTLERHARRVRARCWAHSSVLRIHTGRKGEEKKKKEKEFGAVREVES